jgi:hypothetical protein
VERSSGRSYVSCSDLAMVADVALAFRTNFQLRTSNFYSQNFQLLQPNPHLLTFERMAFCLREKDAR